MNNAVDIVFVLDKKYPDPNVTIRAKEKTRLVDNANGSAPFKDFTASNSEYHSKSQILYVQAVFFSPYKK